MRSLIFTLEQRFGRFAIPGLLRFIVSLQALVWIMLEMGFGAPLMPYLPFNSLAVLAGDEWWRLLSFLVIPVGRGLVWLVLGVPFMWMISDGLEEAWGSFRVNLYIFACIGCVVAEAFLHDNGVYTSWPILASMIMAYSLYFPDQEVSLYGIIPLKMKWIGLMDFGVLLFQFLGGDASTRWNIVASLTPFFVVFGPGLYQLTHHTVKSMERKQRFVASMKPEHESMHRCSRCGKTERDHPHLDFRVNAEGEDICSDCRTAAKS